MVADSTAIGGRTPVGDYVIHNWAYGNRPFDVSYDGSGTGNVFTDNRCGVSHPSSICAH